MLRVHRAGAKTGSGTADVLSGTILGGERDALINRTSGNAGSVEYDVNLSVAGALSYASGSFTSGNALISYDGNDNDASNLNHTGLGGADITGGLVNNQFRIMATSDLGADVTFTVYTDATSCSSGMISVPADPTFTFVEFLIPFASLTTGAGCSGGATFTNVGAVTMFIDGSTEATDVAIELFETIGDIPTPTPTPTNTPTATPTETPIPTDTPDSNSDRNTASDGHSDSNSDRNTSSHGHSDPNSNRDTASDGHSDGGSNVDSHEYSKPIPQRRRQLRHHR